MPSTLWRCDGVRVLGPVNSKDIAEKGLRVRVTSKRLEKSGIELMTLVCKESSLTTSSMSNLRFVVRIILWNFITNRVKHGEDVYNV